MKLLRILFALLILLPIADVAAEEPIDPFEAEITLALRDLRVTKGVMTVSVRRHIPNSDRSPEIQRVTYRFLNDSVYVQSFKDRLISKRHYYVMRGDLVLPFDRKKGCGISNETVITKDSAGYEVEIRVQKHGKDSTVFYSRSHYDSLRDCYVTLKRNSQQPGLEQELEKHTAQKTVTHEFQWKNGNRILLQQVIYVREEGAMSLTETFNTTTFNGDTSVSSERKIVTRYQYGAFRKRLSYVSKIEYLNGSDQYSIIRPVRFFYKD